MFFSALVSPRHRSSSAPPAPPTDSQPAPAVPPPLFRYRPLTLFLPHYHHVVKPLWPALFLFARHLLSSLSLRFGRLLHPFVLAHVVFTRFSALFPGGSRGNGKGGGGSGRGGQSERQLLLTSLPAALSARPLCQRFSSHVLL